LDVQQNLDRLGAKNTLDLFCDIAVFPSQELATWLDDRHSAAEPTESLCHLDTDIAAPQHDQVRRQVVELKCFDMGERTSCLETWDVRNSCMRTNIDDNLIAGKQAGASIVQRDLHGFRAHEAAAAHDEFDATLPVGLQMEGDLAIDHVLLAAADLAHIGSHGISECTELRSVPDEMSDPRTPELILRWEAGDGWTGASDPAALDDGNFLAGTAKVPRKQFSALPATEDDDIEVFSFGHGSFFRLRFGSDRIGENNYRAVTRQHVIGLLSPSQVYAGAHPAHRQSRIVRS
jgi:hypothetical protein